MIRLVLVIFAVILFAVALLVAVGAIASNFDAWLAGGLLAWALAALVAIAEPYRARVPVQQAPPA